MKIALTQKKYIVFLFLVISTISVRAVEFGVNFLTPRYSSLNYMIDVYNDTRPWLNKEMRNVRFMRGFTFGYSVQPWDSKVGFDVFNWSRGTGIVSSEGNGEERELRVRATSFSMMGITYYHYKNSKFKVGAGLTILEFNNNRIATRTNASDEWKTVFESFKGIFEIPLEFSSMPYLQFRYKPESMKKGKMSFGAKLFYRHFWFDKEDIFFVNKELNPDYYNGNFPKIQEMKFNSIGINFTLTYTP